MKEKLTLRTLALSTLLLATLISQPTTGRAQGTAFTYQGRLNENSGPANGSYDFTFQVFDVPTGGGSQGGPTTNLAVNLANGLFTVTVDFGAGPFNGGAPRWLEIAARNSGAGPFGVFTPRQALTATPYAILAGNASNLLGTLSANQLAGLLPSAQVGGSYSNAVAFNNPANSFNGNHAGNGASLSNVNAATLGGLSSSNFWRTSGNVGTTPATHFIGTTDNQPLELKVNNQRGLRLEPTDTNDTVNVIGGSARNVVGVGVVGATIGGGGAGIYLGSARTNRVDADFGTVSGGCLNTIQTNAIAATIGGGYDNTIQTNADRATIGGGFANIIEADTDQSTISGGLQNRIQRFTDKATLGGGVANTIQGNADYSTIGGGLLNTIQNNASSATIGGGEQNTIEAGAFRAVIAGGYQNTIQTNALYATIPGGYNNVATSFAFAAGRQAKAIHTGAFVWADSQFADFPSSGANQFLIRASGGVGINTTNPVADLHVNGPIVIQGPAFTPGGTSSSNLLNLLVGGGSSPVATNGSLNGISFYEGAASKAMSLGYDGSGSSSVNALRIYHSSDAILFTFEASGELGIGTPTPATALHVRNAVDAEISVESSDPGGHRWTMQSSRVTGAVTDASFQIVDRTAGASRLFIATNGNVGVGKTTPATALDVNGTVTATLFQGSGFNLSNINATTVGGLSSSNFWQLGGNAGTTAGTHFLGTTDNQPVEFKVNGLRALRIEDNGDSTSDSGITPDGAPNVIGGAPNNSVAANVVGATIAGGGATNWGGSASPNSVQGDYGVIGGGLANLIQTNCLATTIGGGLGNVIQTNAQVATVSGGYGNTISPDSYGAVIGGGYFNLILSNSPYATIPGGRANAATNSAFAAGYRAKANHTGAFVWADSTEADFSSTGNNQFLIRATGGVGVGTTNPSREVEIQHAGDTELGIKSTDTGGHLWTLQSSSVAGSVNLDASFQIIDRTAGGSRFYIGTNGFVGIGTSSPTNRLHVNGGISATAFVTTSDRNAKENFTVISPAQVLAKVATLPITKWNFKEMKDGPHLGPMAQDFYAAFGLGGGNTTITTVDADGVALAAIQGLNQKVEAGSQRSEDRSRKLEDQLQQKETEIAELRQTVTELKELVQTMNHQLNGGAQ